MAEVPNTLRVGDGVNQLPDLSGVRHPPRALLHNRVLRTAARQLLKRRYDVRVHGVDLVPPRGGFILAANHIGWLDGPLLAILTPRPVHALTKIEMFTGPIGAFLTGAGQIPVHRTQTDPGAVKTALRVLADGDGVGIFPESHRGDGTLTRFRRGAAYLALVSGAPVVPLVLFGTRLPGEGTGTLPRPGSQIDLVFGPAIALPQLPWPRTREHVSQASELLHRRVLEHLDQSRASTGLALPGPPPEAEEAA